MLSAYKGLAFEGGGVLGTSYIGVIEALDELGIYSQLTHIAGSSVGSLAAILVACRLSPSLIKEIMVNLDYQQLNDSSWFIPLDIYHAVYYYGWCAGLALEKITGDLLEKYIGTRNITFSQVFHRYKSYLIITSTNLTTGQSFYSTPDSTPDTPVVQAFRESASYPPLYPPVTRDNMLYIDGGLLDNYPIRQLYNYLPREAVIGCKLVNTRQFITPCLPNNFFSYLKLIVALMHDQNLRIHVRSEDWARTIPINTGSLSCLDFNLSAQDKQNLIDSGRSATIKFFVSSTS